MRADVLRARRLSPTRPTSDGVRLGAFRRGQTGFRAGPGAPRARARPARAGLRHTLVALAIGARRYDMALREVRTGPGGGVDPVATMLRRTRNCSRGRRTAVPIAIRVRGWRCVRCACTNSAGRPRRRARRFTRPRTRPENYRSCTSTETWPLTMPGAATSPGRSSGWSGPWLTRRCSTAGSSSRGCSTRYGTGRSSRPGWRGRGCGGRPAPGPPRGDRRMSGVPPPPEFRCDVPTAELFAVLLKEPLPGGLIVRDTARQFIPGRVRRYRRQRTGGASGSRAASVTVPTTPHHDPGSRRGGAAGIGAERGVRGGGRRRRSAGDPERRHWSRAPPPWPRGSRTTRAPLRTGGRPGGPHRVAAVASARPVRVSYDRVTVRNGRLAREFQELKVRRLARGRPRLEKLARALEQAHGVRPVLQTKMVRARALLRQMGSESLIRNLDLGRAVAVIALDEGRVALLRDGEARQLPVTPGAGEHAVRHGLAEWFGSRGRPTSCCSAARRCRSSGPASRYGSPAGSAAGSSPGAGARSSGCPSTTSPARCAPQSCATPPRSRPSAWPPAPP